MNLPKKEDRKKDPYIFFTSEVVKIYREMARRRELNYYKSTDRWLYQALDKYPIKGMHGIVFGSEKPWYEAVCLEHGAKKLTIVEYNVPDVDIANLNYMHVDDLQEDFQFDFAMSISTFEHTGLGRYGDPINPDGDIDAMAQTLSILKPKALLYLAVPCSIDEKDDVIGNRHRLYGHNRLIDLFKGWELLYIFGTSAKKKWKQYQPVFVLKKNKNVVS